VYAVPVRNRTLATFLGFCALAVFWTWPVAARLTSRLASDGGDPVLNTWILAWNAQVLPFTAEWWNAPILWPMSGALALSEHLLGVSLFATPLQWAGFSAVTAYNLCFVLTYALSGWFGYLLGRRLTGSEVGGLCAGVAFGFSPYRASQLPHVQVLASQWMPLVLLAMHAYVDTAAQRWLIVFGAAWLLQALSNGYYLLFLPILIALWLLWFVDWRRAPRRGLMLVVAWAAASMPLVPILLKYRSFHHALGLTRTLSDIRDFSATPSSWLSAGPLLVFWPPGPLLNGEKHLFPGLTVVLLTVVGLAMVWRTTRERMATAERAPIVFYAASAIVMYVLTLGPGGELNEPVSLLRPYSWLLWLPGFNGLRVPSRLAMLGTLCLAVSAALALASITRALSASSRWRAVVVAVVAMTFAGLTVDGITTAVPVVVPPRRVVLPPGAVDPIVIELPADSPAANFGAMYRWIDHRQPIANGHSGYIPPHFRVLTLALWRGDTSVLSFLARERPLVITVHDELDGSGFRAMVESIPGIQRHGVGGAGLVFLMPRQPGDARRTLGPALTAQVREAGRYQLEFDLGRQRPVSALAFPLRQRHEDLSDRLLIETSDDGETWREAWRGRTGAFALEATLIDALAGPVQIPLSGATGRYVRVYPAAAWMKSELRVH
jgi:hypothetical protein